MNTKFPALISLLALLAGTVSAQTPERAIYFGADLSYVNEMKACGATYSYQGKTKDPYDIFADSGTNLVRVRLWNDAKWTKYSNLRDVALTLKAARDRGQKVLLDFHYSDDWADGGKQLVPAAWANLSEDDQVKALYSYTFNTLTTLAAQGLMPDLVQVGNETNGEILRSHAEEHAPINWVRNARLFNAGIAAVHDAARTSLIKPKVMLHIAQPENVEPWFDAASRAGVTGYDIIGMSYYAKWSKENLTGLGETVQRAHAKFGKDVIVVETGYPFTDQGADSATNLLGSDSALPGYPVTPEGQAKYMHDIMQTVLDNGGVGVVYWEPAWVSTSCRTRWAQGSDWENAAFFDFKGQALPSLSWPRASYILPVALTISVKDSGQKSQYLAADFTGGVHVAMKEGAGSFTYTAWLRPGSHVLIGTSSSEEALDSAEALDVTVPGKAGEVVLSPPQVAAH